MRGNPEGLGNRRCDYMGSIPACAGEPPAMLVGLRIRVRVYPRVCGGTDASPGHAVLHLGAVYPRVCGGTAEPLSPVISDDIGSIPACAGEPCDSGLPTRPTSRVYPRVCGGTIKNARLLRHIRARSIPACAGEPTLPIAAESTARSIPACAGEPPYYRVDREPA